MRSERISQLIKENGIFNAYDEAIFGNGASEQSFLDLSCGARTDIREIIQGLGHTWVGIVKLIVLGSSRAMYTTYRLTIQRLIWCTQQPRLSTTTTHGRWRAKSIGL